MVGGWHFEDDGWMDDGWCSEKKLKCSSIPLRVACTSIVVEFTDSHDDIRAYQPRQLTVKGSDWSLYKESRSDDVLQITTTNKNQESRNKNQETRVVLFIHWLRQYTLLRSLVHLFWDADNIIIYVL